MEENTPQAETIDKTLRWLQNFERVAKEPIVVEILVRNGKVSFLEMQSVRLRHKLIGEDEEVEPSALPFSPLEGGRLKNTVHLELGRDDYFG